MTVGQTSIIHYISVQLANIALTWKLEGFPKENWCPKLRPCVYICGYPYWVLASLAKPILLRHIEQRENPLANWKFLSWKISNKNYWNCFFSGTNWKRFEFIIFSISFEDAWVFQSWMYRCSFVVAVLKQFWNFLIFSSTATNGVLLHTLQIW